MRTQKLLHVGIEERKRSLHQQQLALECTHGRQLKAWCDKLCETHHKECLAAQNKSGNADDIPKATVLDTVAADWAEYHLRSGKTSKLNKKHAEFIREMCVKTSISIPEFANRIASAREKHNAVERTNAKNAGTPVVVSASPLSTTPKHIGRVTRETLNAAISAALDPNPRLPSCPGVSDEVVANFTAELVAAEMQVYTAPDCVSKLEAHVPTIMRKLGVACLKDFDELEEGQEDLCDLPVLAMNRLRAVLRARRNA
jgi:hypothetical protein